MSPEQQRIALCEWAGWTCDKSGIWRDPRGCYGVNGCPANTNSLDVLHEMVQKLTPEQHDDEYYFWLAFVIGGRRMDVQVWEYRKLMVDATAAQRREALLRTLGLWMEDK